MAGPHHRTYAYQRAARHLVALANANPDTRCARCGQPARPGDPWEAGHINDGQINGPLQPEHRSCNRAAGAQAGNSRRRPLRTTRDWLA